MKNSADAQEMLKDLMIEMGRSVRSGDIMFAAELAHEISDVALFLEMSLLDENEPPEGDE